MPKDSNVVESLFTKQYKEFADDLLTALPELKPQIQASLALSQSLQKSQFLEEVQPNCGPGRDMTKCPGTVLPGVTIPESLWRDVGLASQKAIHEHLSLLSFCAMYNGASAKPQMDASGNPTFDWASDEFLKAMRETLGGMDFEAMSQKLAGLFQNLGPDALPKIPERLLKGHLGRFVDELIKEFKPEDFGLSEEELKQYDADPMKAFHLLTEIYTNRPNVLQNTIKRIAFRLQEKIRRGELRPEQIASEAEEMMKEFSEDGAFVELMKSFKGMFGMEDPEVARKAGNSQSARGALVRERLRKKMEAKRAASGPNKK
jgi:hypothetical protein